ncbi:MAG: magnesium transporter [Proteobacteria bacterium]|nr:magnesium transporter [Pseudomonadota bacterium]
MGGLRTHSVFVPWMSVREFGPTGVTLASSRLDLRPFTRRDGELLVGGDVLDKQVVDVDGRRVVRVNDVQLAPDPRVPGGWRVAAADISVGSFLARVVPRWMVPSVRNRFPANVVISWDQVEFFASDVPGVKLRVDHTNLARMHPADLAELIAELGYRQTQEVLAALDDERAADVVEWLPSEVQAAVLTSLDDEKAGDILDEMEKDVAADILADLPREEARDLLDAMEPDEAADLSRLLAHAPNTAGGLMSTEYLSVGSTLTVAETIKRLREADWLPDEMPYLYVLESEPDGRLVGTVTLRDLVLAEPDTRLDSLMVREVITLTVDMSADDVADEFTHYDLVAMPVVDDDGRLLGIVTVDDAIDVLLPNEWRPRIPRIFH